MIFTFIVLLFKATIYADWVLIKSSYIGSIISSYGSYGIINPFDQCNTNALQYELLDYNNNFFYSPDLHYKGFQVKVIFDLFLIGADSFYFSTMSCRLHDLAIGTYDEILRIQYQLTDSNQMSNRICKAGVDSFFNFTTQVITWNGNTKYFHFHFELLTYTTANTAGIRNLMIYVNACYPNCQTCSGQQQNQCLTCYYGTPALGICICDPEHQFSMTSIGCLQECPRDNYLPNQELICILDNRIKSYSSYFTGNKISTTNNPRYYPFNFISDSFNTNNRPLVSTDCVNSQEFVGLFFHQEGVVLQIGQIYALKFIRLRITFVLFNLLADSTIRIYSEDILQAQFQKATNYVLTGFTNIYAAESNTLSCNEVRIRLESIFRTNTLNPTLKIQGSLSISSESWGFFNVTIDAGLCQENCQICSDFDTCSQCVTGYIMYQNRCLQSYPIHSQNGIDYADEYLYSRYLAKGFYNLNMTIDDINTYFDSVTNNSTNFKTGQMFSFFLDKFVLGGPMVWYDASYIKTFSVTQPHYAISIRFNFTFGDEYPGQFYYIIDSVQYGPFTVPSSGGQNLVGKTQKEITQFFYNYLSIHTSNTLNIEFKCVAPPLPNYEIRDGFCAISDYFIVVHYVFKYCKQCPPFCVTCSSLIDCTSWYSGYTSSTCASNRYLTFDESTSIYSCKICSQPGCLACKSLEECTLCTNTASNQFYLSNGVCYCQPFAYLSGSSCTLCNKYCEKCYGLTQSNCLSCASEFHRIIINHECLCQQGYYDDGYNLPCQPICGDQLIVDGEDCDDGNFNPHDGCDQCKFSCQLYCDLCILGICEQCHNGFILFENQCILTYSSYYLANAYQQFHDVAQDSYFNDEIFCPFGCQVCQFNKCIQCNYGYYLQDKIFLCSNLCENVINFNKELCQVCKLQGMPHQLETSICQSKCGDQIVASNEECDEENEYGCKNCKYQCQPECLDCQKGKCLKCIQGWGFEMNKNYCIPTECGDQIIMPGYEDCDDGNTNPLDGCYQCKFQCQKQCTDCHQDLCYECNVEGWYLKDHICLPNCGDGFVIDEYEQCDDGNDEQYDGCHNCQYQCQEQCTSCQEGICYECDNLGWIEANNRCKTFCGDGLVKGKEQCDDQNNDDNDGCYQCKFKCDEFCTNCVGGICFECVPGKKILQTQLNRCETECGDGFYVELKEQCDDGNDINNDGCDSNCKIENNYACINTYGSVSICIYSKQPEMILTLLPSDSSNQIVQLTFTQQMMKSQKIQGEILDYIVANIQNMPIDQYSISLELNQPPSIIQVYEVVVIFKIKFYSSLQRPLLKVKIANNLLISQYEQYIKKNEATVILASTFIISEQAQSLALSTQQFNKIVIYLLISLSILCLITGSTDLFWNLLDQLQYLSYIKYINIQFPQNLNLYFEAFKLISISPLLTLLKFDQFFSLFDGIEDYQIKTSDKFLQDNLNAYFLVNIQSFLFCVIFSFFLYTINYFLTFILYQIPQHLINKINLKFVQFVEIRASNFSTMEFCDFLCLTGMIQVSLLFYSSLIINLDINQYLAMFFFLTQVWMILFILGKVNTFLRKTTFVQRRKYKTLFEDIKNCKKVWIMQYNSILLLKKQLFILILVFMQQLGVLQAISITMLQTFYLVYIITQSYLAIEQSSIKLQRLKQFQFLMQLHLQSILFKSNGNYLKTQFLISDGFTFFHRQ